MLRVSLLSASFVLLASLLVSADACTFPSQRTDCGDLTCNVSTGQCVPCTDASQCWDQALVCGISEAAAVLSAPGDLKSKMRCKMMPISDQFLKHTGGTVTSIFVAISVCAIAVIGGVGGGGLLAPLFQVMMGIPIVNAVGLSQATIAGQSLFNVFLQMQRFHPNAQPPKPTRPVINYALLCFWLPITLVGTMWGNLVGKVVPDWFRMALLFILVSYALKRTVDRMMDQRREDATVKVEAGASTVRPLPPILSTVINRSNSNRGNGDGNVDDDDDEDEEEDVSRDAGSRTGLLDENRRSATPSPTKKQSPPPGDGLASPTTKTGFESAEEMIETPKVSSSSPVIATASSPTSVVVTTSAATSPKQPDAATVSSTEAGCEHRAQQQRKRGSNTDDDEAKDAPQYPPLQIAIIVAVFVPLTIANLVKNRWVECNGLGFWLVNAFITFYNIAIAFAYRQHLAALHEKIAVGDEPQESVPFVWNEKTSIWFPIFSITAGMAASLVGVGGGILLNILFLEAGLTPEETSATGGTATLLVCLETLVHFIIQGKIRSDFGAVFFACGLFSTVIGQSLVMPEIRKRGWRFLIIGCLAFIMAGSLLTSITVGVYDTVELWSNGGAAGFAGLCGGHGGDQ